MHLWVSDVEHLKGAMIGIIEQFPGYLRFHATCTSMFKDNFVDRNPMSTILSWQQLSRIEYRYVYSVDMLKIYSFCTRAVSIWTGLKYCYGLN